ncbi:hypothetical protein C8Q80DRAFT_959650 [Daedaleopsis nitida]|nr:hypothetical protein C8Q80DRAFT_959650 [Daedaleopsis nitida]
MHSEPSTPGARHRADVRPALERLSTLFRRRRVCSSELLRFRLSTSARAPRLSPVALALAPSERCSRSPRSSYRKHDRLRCSRSILLQRRRWTASRMWSASVCPSVSTLSRMRIYVIVGRRLWRRRRRAPSGLDLAACGARARDIALHAEQSYKDVRTGTNVTPTQIFAFGVRELFCCTLSFICILQYMMPAFELGSCNFCAGASVQVLPRRRERKQLATTGTTWTTRIVHSGKCLHPLRDRPPHPSCACHAGQSALPRSAREESRVARAYSCEYREPYEDYARMTSGSSMSRGRLASHGRLGGYVRVACLSGCSSSGAGLATRRQLCGALRTLLRHQQLRHCPTSSCWRISDLRTSSTCCATSALETPPVGAPPTVVLAVTTIMTNQI